MTSHSQTAHRLESNRRKVQNSGTSGAHGIPKFDPVVFNATFGSFGVHLSQDWLINQRALTVRRKGLKCN